MIYSLAVAAHLRGLDLVDHLTAMATVRRRDDAGQATSEYSLVLLGAAAVAMLLLAWATKTNKVGKLLDFVMSEIVGRAR
jgi:hypothetical protein